MLINRNLGLGLGFPTASKVCAKKMKQVSVDFSERFRF